MTETSTTRLVTARTLRRMTQRRVAKRARISASYLAELEKTNEPPSADVQQRLARVLGFAISELWPENESEVA